MKQKNLLPIIFVLVCVVILAVVIGKTFFRPARKAPSAEPTTAPKVVFPTKTPEEIQIISKMETHSVLISEKKAEPETLEVKLHDQVRFVNNTQKTIVVEGKGWGDVPLEPGENLTEAFDESGAFSYTVTEFNQSAESTFSVSGEVIVR